MSVRLVFSLLLWTYVHASWFPELKLSAGEWDTALANYNPASSYQTCSTAFSRNPGSHTFVPLYKDKPMTIVITGSGSGKLDVKFKDSTYVFDHKANLKDDSCLVIPPYQPVEWVMLNFPGHISVCLYENTKSSQDSTKAVGCDCDAVMAKAPTCTAVTFPRTVRKPEQEFFLTADVTPKTDDVTICTILTVDRLLRLSQMSQFWGGPISAAVYLHELNEVSTVMEWWLANNTLRRNVDIHLVYDDKIIAFELPDRAFPVNILRNVAVRYARTANVFYIEGDFIPSPDLYSNLDTVKQRLASGEKTVFIVAPFSSDNAGFDMELFPKNKQELLEMTTKANPLLRDLSYFNSHSAFNFQEWFKSKSIYSVPYTGGYEPYYIGPKYFPLFEEIFIGCGQDKVSHPTELNAAGFTFHTLPTGFIVHIDSTGMGSAWCRGWAGNERSTMKWEAFSVKTSHLYSNKPKGSFDSRVPWWDLAPVGGNLKAIAPEADVCTEAPPPAEKECPPCPSRPIDNPAKCGPPTPETCLQLTEGYTAEIEQLKITLKKMENTLKSKQAEVDMSLEYSKRVINVSIGGVVVFVVVVGVGLCVWPRGKKVWALPTWKATHHNL